MRVSRIAWVPVVAILAALSVVPRVSARDAGRVRTGSAPTILHSLAPAWIDAFHHAHPGDQLRLAARFGSPQGALDPALLAFLQGRRDFAFITREVAETDLATFRAAHGGIDPIVMPVAAGRWDRFGYLDAVVVIVNAANPVRALDFRQLDAMFSTTRLRGGSVSDWGAAGVDGWAGRPIRLVGGGAWSGEESARALTIRRRILDTGGARGVWRAAPGSGGEDDVVARVAADPLAIGFTGYGHLAPGVRVVPLSAAGVATLPSEQTIATGRYPLARTVDLLLAPAQGGRIDPVLRRFARFLIGPRGQQVVREDGVFLPLPLPAVRQARCLARETGRLAEALAVRRRCPGWW